MVGKLVTTKMKYHKRIRTKVNYRNIAEIYYGISAKGMHVHHKDVDCHNNDPKNLVICTVIEHAEYHRKLGQNTIADMLLGIKTGNYTLSDKALKQRADA